MEQNELISVIVPVYNVECYVARCIESIQRQTYENLEIILIDDGSEDQSGKICEEYAAGDSRIKVIHQQNAGLSGARNAGLDIATGKYIGFVDSDDTIVPTMLEKLIGILYSTNADAAFCEHYSKKQDLDEICDISIKVLNAEEVFGELAKQNNWGVWHNVYRAEIWRDIRFEVGRYFEDALIFPQIINKVEKWAFTNEKLYYYNNESQSITRKEMTVKHIEDVMKFLNNFDRYLDNEQCHTADNAVCLCINWICYINMAMKSSLISEQQIKQCNDSMRVFFAKNYHLAKESHLYKAFKWKTKIRWQGYYVFPYLSQSFFNIFA